MYVCLCSSKDAKGALEEVCECENDQVWSGCFQRGILDRFVDKRFSFCGWF